MAKQRKPRILFFDIETSPILAYIWRPGSKISVSHNQVKKGQKTDIICICYKWAHEKKIHSLDWDIKKQNSAKMIDEFTKIVESADLVIGHNGDRFDIKHVNTQRLLHGQAPIMWPTSEDTLKQFRRIFALPSYRLDFLAKLLVGAGKDPMSFQDWIDIVEHKSPKALKKMIKYCKKDVLRLQEVYDKVKAFFPVKIHAGIVMRGEKSGCPRCGSEKTSKQGKCYRAASVRQMHSCKDCGHAWRAPIPRQKKSAPSKRKPK